MKVDAISIVEAAYDSEGDTRAWFRRLLEHVAPKIDRGFGVCAVAYVPNGPPEELLCELYGMTGNVSGALAAMTTAHSDIFHQLNRIGPTTATASKTMGLTAEQAGTWPPYVDYMHALGIRDIVGVLARDPSGHAVNFGAPASDLRQPSRSEVAIWSRITAHISSGARLRRAFAGAPNADVAEGADAILSPTGAVAHAEAGAQGPNARELLRRAAKAIDRARSRARSNDDEALDLWQGLVAGRWSLVDRFDSDGRRFLVARKNDPEVTDPRALTLRERQVLAYVAMGHSLKLVAYSLGVSANSVSNTRVTAMRKLGLRTQADVARLFAYETPPEKGLHDR